MPDRNYRSSTFDFKTNASPDGVIEYFGKAFGGKLDHRMMICRYSGGDDVVVLDVNADGSVGNYRSGISGLSHFVDPLDLTEDTRSGNVYIVYVGQAKAKIVQREKIYSNRPQPS